jgi:hypothetical protein
LTKLAPSPQRSTAPPRNRNHTANTHRLHSQTSPSNPRPLSDLPEDPEIVALRTQVLSDSDISSFQTKDLERLIFSLRSYAHEQADSEDYDEAQKAQDLSHDIIDELKVRNTSRYDSGLEAPDVSTPAAFAEKWQERFNEYDEMTELRKSALLSQLKHERDMFDRTWRNEMPAKYRKPSQRLLQMKKIEQSFSASGDYQRAKQVHLEAETLLQQEMELAQNRLFRDYQVALDRIESKHQIQSEQFDAQRLHGRDLLNVEYEAEKAAQTNRDKVRENKPTKPRSALAMGGYAPLQTRSGQRSGTPKLILLPPLKAPNDPHVLEEQERQRREEQRKKLAFQKQNAEASLNQFALPPMPAGFLAPQKRNVKKGPKPALKPKSQLPKPGDESAAGEEEDGPTPEDEEYALAEAADSSETGNEMEGITTEVSAFADTLASITEMAAGGGDPSVLNLTEVTASQDPESTS